jgi:hypothetical protein
VSPLANTPEEWWDLLNHAPKVAGPWEEYQTETQRVKLMMVRRRSRQADSDIVVLAYGPHFDMTKPDDLNPDDPNRNRWIVTFREGYCGWHLATMPGSFGSIEEAMAAADARLSDENWLLVKGNPFLVGQQS